MHERTVRALDNVPEPEDDGYVSDARLFRSDDDCCAHRKDRAHNNTDRTDESNLDEDDADEGDVDAGDTEEDDTYENEDDEDEDDAYEDQDDADEDDADQDQDDADRDDEDNMDGADDADNSDSADDRKRRAVARKVLSKATVQKVSSLFLSLFTLTFLLPLELPLCLAREQQPATTIQASSRCRSRAQHAFKVTPEAYRTDSEVSGEFFLLFTIT